MRHRRFHLHFTPTGGSWLNLVELWLALLTEKQLRRGAHRARRELQDAIRAYLEHHDRYPKPFIWTKTADQILSRSLHFVNAFLTQDTKLSWGDRLMFEGKRENVFVTIGGDIPDDDFVAGLELLAMKPACG